LKTYLKTTGAMIALGLFFFLNASPSLAFLPSVNWIMNRTVALYLQSPVKSIRVGLEGYDITEASQKLARSERVYFKRGYNFRREASQGEKSIVEIMGKGNVVSRVSDFPAEVFPEFMQLYYTLHEPDKGPKGSAVLLAALERTGVDTSVISINRQDAAIVWVIGAKPWEPNKTQVWLTKDYFRPVKIILNNGRDVLDWRFMGEQRFDDLPFLFSGLELRWNGRLLRKLDVTEFKMNQKLSKDLFIKK
jgi:hypothetical protein